MRETSGTSAPIKSILIIEDDLSLLDATARYLKRQGYEVVTASSGQAAFDVLESSQVDLLISDVLLPDMDGTAMIEELAERHPDSRIVMMSGLNDAGFAAQCFQMGALDYLVKPFSMAVLERIIEQIATRVVKEGRDLLASPVVKALDRVVAEMEAKDPIMAGHSGRVADLATATAIQLKLPEHEVDVIRVAARLHDIGNLGVNEAIFRQPGALDDAQRLEVRRHVEIGLRILAPVPGLDAVRDMIAAHHEAWDGSGYPAGVSGDGIPIGGRIVAAAEVFDAVSEIRSYSPPAAEPLAVLRDAAGSQLDEAVVAALESAVGGRRTLALLDG